MNDQFDYTQPVDYNADGFATPQNEKKPNKKATAALVQTEMQNAFALDVPLLAEVNYGKDWASAK